jgi:hypothetical protein
MTQAKSGATQKRKSTTPAQPSFVQMIQEAAGSVGGRKGISRQAMKKFISDHFKVSELTMRMRFNRALKKAVDDKLVSQNKQSFRLVGAPKSDQSRGRTKASSEQKKPRSASAAPAAKKTQKVSKKRSESAAPASKPKAETGIKRKRDASSKPSAKKAKTGQAKSTTVAIKPIQAPKQTVKKAGKAQAAKPAKKPSAPTPKKTKKATTPGGKAKGKAKSSS